MAGKDENAKKIVIIGAGPAGLTAAYELLKKGNYELTILEKSHALGGLSRTVNYKGLRMDIGGHRFFSKSDVVMEWWQNILPIESHQEGEQILHYQGEKTKINIPSTDKEKGSMMVRNRKSSILYLRKRFDYPLNLSLETMKKFGFWRLVKITISYFFSKFIISKPQNLEQFFIKRFGKTLYLTFFKSYTEKVWGVPCNEISAEWGEQRIKKLSFSRALFHFFKPKNQQISQKNVETSLIERFLYPRLGPGQMWEAVAEEIKKKGGKIIFGARVTELSKRDGVISNVLFSINSNKEILEADEVISTMPVNELLAALPKVPQTVIEIGKGLKYRDFITVGILVDRERTVLSSYEDNWIYIQESDVKLARLQLFNNWSPYLVEAPNKLWLGLEYFCTTKDAIWQMSDEQLIDLCADELQKLKLIEANAIEDFHIVREEKTYPAYFGTYDQFNVIRSYTDEIPNLFLIGRNGMHRYNNQDHSMLTAMEVAHQIHNNQRNKSLIWEINTEQTYHESK